jgi:hypothetical protein
MRDAGLPLGGPAFLLLAGVCAIPLDSCSQETGELVGGELAVAQDLVEQAGADGFARMHRHNGAPAILVT